MCSGQEGPRPGTDELDEDTQHCVDTHLSREQLHCCQSVAISQLRGNSLDFCSLGLQYQSTGTAALGHPNAPSFALWYNLVSCNKIRMSLSMTRQRYFCDA